MIDIKKYLPSIIKDFLFKGHERSVKAKKNIIASFIIRGLSIVVSFLIVPLALHYLDATKYGVWLTLSSFIGWFGFFDIGLGNGLRNKFAEALARGEKELARIYVSTTYAILGIIIFLVFIIFIVINPLINWSIIFNTPTYMAKEISTLVLIIFTFFCFQFVFKLIGIVLTADQKPAINNFLGLIGNVLSLIVIFILTKTTEGSLLFFGITLSGSSVLVYLTANILLYKTKYKIYSPKFTFVRFKYAKNLLNVGFKFFIIQIEAIIIFSTDNIIITQLLGPAEVVPYNIAFKYFGIISMIFSIFTTPFWSAYTEAYTKGDFVWIKKTTQKLKQIWIFLSVFSIIMLIISPFFYKLWIGDKIIIPFSLSLSMFIYVNIVNWGSIFVTFINGVGKLKLQLIISFIASILNIPLSVLFAKTFHLGSAGVIIATILCLSYGAFLAPLQYKKIINNTAKGIWNK